MQIIFSGRHVDVSEELKNYATEKLQRVLHRDPAIHKIAITFHLVNVTYTAEANVHSKGYDINAEADAGEMYAAVDLLIDKLLTQITKHKEKIIDQHR